MVSTGNLTRIEPHPDLVYVAWYPVTSGSTRLLLSTLCWCSGAENLFLALFKESGTQLLVVPQVSFCLLRWREALFHALFKGRKGALRWSEQDQLETWPEWNPSLIYCMWHGTQSLVVPDAQAQITSVSCLVQGKWHWSQVPVMVMMVSTGPSGNLTRMEPLPDLLYVAWHPVTSGSTSLLFSALRRCSGADNLCFLPCSRKVALKPSACDGHDGLRCSGADNLCFLPCSRKVALKPSACDGHDGLNGSIWKPDLNGTPEMLYVAWHPGSCGSTSLFACTTYMVRWRKSLLPCSRKVPIKLSASEVWKGPSGNLTRMELWPIVCGGPIHHCFHQSHPIGQPKCLSNPISLNFPWGHWWGCLGHFQQIGQLGGSSWGNVQEMDRFESMVVIPSHHSLIAYGLFYQPALLPEFC
jgi:hypothetical protein